jgi:hypothetical protein
MPRKNIWSTPEFDSGVNNMPSFGQTKGGILKSCLRVPKLRVRIVRGWGRCLKVDLQTHVPMLVSIKQNFMETM